MNIAAIAIGASAGAVEALSGILPHLPEGFPVPVFVVVHLPPDKKSAMVELFQGKCRLAVREAEDKADIEPGTVYFAPPDYHLLVEQSGQLSLSSEEPVLFSRPSIDILFETAADAYGNALLGIVLSGANEDGARGLKTILAHGGQGWVQDPATAKSPFMPQAALKRCPGAIALTLKQMSEHLQKLDA